ncbi:sigma-70 family RNA polymerase sigma factor [Clostridium sp. KNHs214]|uniref:RNA polymerase sigma factor n=1 Tax=Clostridium sp. KNHs214 TaxID=1540257 RepID=UPI000550380A|nr:sigma-70 family RNA polymerase sigma factor [Clostridium sp. KNHs214]
MDKYLYLLINKWKSKDKDALLILIQKFNPLIQKYSKKLMYDGAESDLTIAFIEILNKIPLEKATMKNSKFILSYINTSIKNKFIKLSKYNNAFLYNEIKLNLEITMDCNNNSIEDSLILNSALSNLSKYQRKIIIDKFFKEKSEIEISKELGISRQAVNKTKNIALKKLKKYLTKKQYTSY